MSTTRTELQEYRATAVATWKSSSLQAQPKSKRLNPMLPSVSAVALHFALGLAS